MLPSPTDSLSASPYPWRFFRVGGVDQVRLDKGADIFALDQLDQKLWVALSCPTSGLDFDSRTLELLDTDKDGHVRPREILDTVAWLRSVLKSGDRLLKVRQNFNSKTFGPTLKKDACYSRRHSTCWGSSANRPRR